MNALRHPRVYCPDLRADGAEVDLPPDEAEHLRRVLRMRDGDRISVFDGRGREHLARIRLIGRQGVRALPLEPLSAARESSLRITLGQAVLKADRMDAVVRDATMLGVAAIQPMTSAHTLVSDDSLIRGRRLERWHRVAVASAKQSGRAVVPAVLPTRDLEAVLAPDRALRIVLVEPASGRGGPLGADVGGRATQDVVLIVGPEGGWSERELELAERSGARLCTLGERTLRAESAAVVALSALMALWQAW